MSFAASLRCATLSLFAAFASVANVVDAAESISFNRDIRPILAETCFHCHGPDPGSRKADLRLDREESFFAKDNPLVVPGKPEASPLCDRVLSRDPDEQMPPPDAHKQLTDEQRQLLKRWVAEGAKWQPHWSFLPPQRPQLPAVKNAAWTKNPIDRFVAAGLDAAGLEPATEATPETLCRRVYLDLTGLPPTPEELQLYLNDSGTDRYERLVERLLASPRYGEHRARYWLDAARYADTHGLHFDNYREMWPYRDWVINSFNRNQPFDEFTVEQLAGDLLPNPTVEQKIATGFHRCNMTTNEGGTIADENLANYARDRVETTSWVWLGLTANCAVCHDHKFDPITQRDFYSMSAFFRNTTQGSHDGNIKDTKPVLFLPGAMDAPRYNALPTELAAARDAQNKRRGAAAKAIDEFLTQVKPDEVDLAAAGLVKHERLVGGQAPATAEPLGWRPDGKFGPAPVLPAGETIELGDVAGFGLDQPFSVSLWVRPAVNLNDGTLVARSPVKGAGPSWELSLFQGGKLSLAINSAEPKGSLRAISRRPVARPGVWVHVTATYDGSGRAEGITLFTGGEPQNDANRSGGPLTPVAAKTQTPGVLRLGARAAAANQFAGGSLQDVRIYAQRLPAGDVKTLSTLHDLRNVARIAPAKRNAQQKDRLTMFFLENFDKPYIAAREKVVSLEDEQRAIEARSTITHVQEEKMNSPAMANILLRGDYAKLGDKVDPTVFAALSPLPAGAERNRLGLAQWLVDPKNPLPARVTVNRFWQEVFGTGLVKTAEDFGIMGEAPSHPELLDWLAVEFRESGWDVKHLFRLMVLSNTYRQAAVATPAKLAKDRDNRLLSRGPRFRMDAEMIRDYALAVSGELAGRMGGPSVRPYQPEGIWDVVGLPGGNTREYKQDTGDSLYRRSLYTFWKRMAPPPNLETFNAPAREFSCLRRERTNTPLQALVTLNDPTFVEAARNVAQRVLQASDGEPQQTLTLAVERILCRALKPEEAKVWEAALADLLSYYHGHRSDAEALIKTGESRPNPTLDAAQLAAWTNICNAMLNLDEVLNK
ncbi:MAG: DUF1553 domain-containing protein [Planctomycetes bacterium]|nr:DUF1553 domain-containing protein [Planctomycetota bacterium]